ncbi:neuroblastoma suppressor of tumorigenicity 1-like [Aplysia californica]|uniref:Neuroblastoma suppressor of tumorigenicity 1-like n=1 Tax=Aplysia californica TaxID=6500 RepID=A0ABM0JLJ0_APLCA|nr:neuroblastoma suppressor of tumorigenicity 1-like [Aplysia californica]
MKAQNVVKKNEGSSLVNAIISESPVSSSSSTCRHRIETTLIAVPGCVPKSLLITRCQGSCHSRSVPEFDTDRQEVRHVEHCSCCKPMVMKFRAVRFTCPRRRQRFFVKRFGFPFRCACRPCANVPEVTAEQPYDY